MFLIIFFVDCYLIMLHYAYVRNERYIISSDIENSYRQPICTYENNFSQFCTSMDFINPNYKPKEVYVILSVNTDFNIDYIIKNSKTRLSSNPLNNKEAADMFDEKIANDSQKTKIENYLNSSPKNIMVFCKYKNNLVDVEKSFTINNK
ncbi:hypothetical protein J2Z42_002699 [Clostridium algifaecis]|uniref:DUF4825 domain-containing protein n=2 Tax=Clostridium algifaecis TaxID=1472040 RepID=A0ABS4KVC3_9CLOT|nr:hypothetical protein [Clostridium algifaecis]